MANWFGGIMVGALSITSLVAGFVAALMGILGLTLPEEQLHGRTCFVLFCTASGAWAFAHFLILNFSASSGPLASTYSSSVFWLGAATLLGIGGAPTYWFLFAAAISGRKQWLRPARIALIHAPFVYLLVVGLTNPLHHLYISIDPTTGGAVYGPLAFVHLAIVVPLVVVGLFWMTTFWWNRGAITDRRRALVIGVAASTALTGGLYHVLRTVAGQPSSDMAPGLFILLAVGLAFELFTSGLRSETSDPAGTRNRESDARILLDRDTRIRSLDACAEKLFPGALPGRLLREFAPEIARHAEFCIHYQCDGLTFETECRGSTLWGHVDRSLDADAHCTGCVVSLADTTVQGDAPGASKTLLEPV